MTGLARVMTEGSTSPLPIATTCCVRGEQAASVGGFALVWNGLVAGMTASILTGEARCLHRMFLRSYQACSCRW